MVRTKQSLERFTERARVALQLGEREARQRNCEYVGTEHLLLGLALEGHGIAAKVLETFHFDAARLRRYIEEVATDGSQWVGTGELTCTPRAEQVLECALEEAGNMGHAHVATEHLLLGLIRSGDCFATQLLMNYGLSAENVRDEVLRLLKEPWEEKLSRHWLGWCPRCRVEMIRGDAAVTHSASGWLSALIERGLSRGGFVFTPREEGPVEVISAKQSRAAWRCPQCGVIVIAGE